MAEYFLNADTVSNICGISKSKAYAIIKMLNNELKEANYIVISGRVPREYFYKRMNIQEVSVCQ
jgi:hypothetical protein